MELLLTDEFEHMERLLAGLMESSDQKQQTKLLSIHQRLQTIHSDHAKLHQSRDRLRHLKSELCDDGMKLR